MLVWEKQVSGSLMYSPRFSTSVGQTFNILKKFMIFCSLER